MSDPFRIGIDIEEQRLGQVLRTLDQMPGVVTIHLNMSKGQEQMRMLEGQMKPTTNIGRVGVLARLQQRKPRTVLEGGTVRDIIAKALSKGAMHYRLIGEVIMSQGLAAVSVNSAITKMSADKTIERVAPGTYRLTKRGERRYLKAESNVQRLHGSSYAPGGAVDNRKGLRALILGSLLKKNFQHTELRNMLIENDYSSNNMYNIVLKLREEGLIKRTDNDYEITETGRAALAEPSAVIENDAKHGDAS